jgi:hypothetical protein
MTEKTRGREFDVLMSEIANLREEIAGLAANVLKSTGSKREKAGGSNRTADAPEDLPGEDQGGSAWEELLEKFTASRSEGEKVVKGLATKVERHPLLGMVAAFSLGFIIAKVWYQDEK